MLVQSFILIVHVAVGLLLIGLVLLQRGKGADAGAGFGAGASGTVCGSRGASSFLSRTTAVLATMFFATSLTLAYLAGQPTAPTSLMEQGMEMPEPGAEITPVPPSGSDLPELPELPEIGVAPDAPAEGEAQQ
jgi:preprotein translocase subunit SecG